MIELLDYVLDYNDNFWIVESFFDNVAYGLMMYKQSDNGDRLNKITNKKYIKNNPKNLIPIPKYKRIFKPNEFYKMNVNNLHGIWKKYIEVLNSIGIDNNNIGIFGSYLIGFDIIKDVDFIIYNKENLKKYLDNKDYINKKLNVTNISKEHIEYQCNKFKKHFNDLSDIKKIISRNITGIQISKRVLSTPRFIEDKTYSIPKDNNKREVLKLEVIESINTSLIPRIAKVKLNNKIYELITPIWKYDSYLRDGDIIELKGSRLKETNYSLQL